MKEHSAPSALSWTILFHHDGHIHPGGEIPGTAGSMLNIATTGHDYEGNTRYEIILTATDATGLRTSTSVTVFPEKVNLSFATMPSGFELEIDGIRRQAPLVVDSLVGFEHTIAAPSQTGGDGVARSFMSWSDGGAQTHTLVTLAVDQSYVATFASIGRVLVCHHGRTKFIDEAALPGHLGHGDTEGFCPGEDAALVCHKSRKTILARGRSLAARLRHGDTLGACLH